MAMGPLKRLRKVQSSPSLPPPPLFFSLSHPHTYHQ